MASAQQAVSQPLLLPRERAFGDDLAPPRAAYFAYIPASLAIVGMLSWMLGDDIGFLLGCAVASAAGLYTLWGWLARKGPTRFSTLTAMALLLGYGAGALNTWATLPRGGLSISATMGLPDGVLARAIGGVLMAAAPLYCLGEIFEKPLFGRDFRVAIDQRTRTLVLLGASAIVAGYAAHIIAFHGEAAGGHHLNAVGSFLSWLYPPLTAIAVTAFLTAPRGRQKLLCGLAALALLLLFSIVGRRATVYTAVEILFVLELAAYQWRGRIFHKVLLVLALAGIVVATSLAFMLFRIAGFNARNPHRVTVGKRIEGAGKLVQQGDAYQIAATSTRENVQRRTFLIGFLASVLEGSMRRAPAHGVDAIKQAEMVVPSFLYPNKDYLFSEEGLVDSQFGYGFGDQANSILTAGVTDFGFAGMLLYPLLLVAFARIVYEFIARWLRGIPLMFIALSLIYISLQTEMTLTGYLDAVRVAFFFGLALAIFMALPRFQLRDHSN